MAKIYEQWIDKSDIQHKFYQLWIWNDLVQIKHLSFDLLPDHPVDIPVPDTLPDTLQDGNLPHPVLDLLSDHPVDIPAPDTLPDTLPDDEPKSQRKSSRRKKKVSHIV